MITAELSQDFCFLAMYRNASNQRHATLQTDQVLLVCSMPDDFKYLNTDGGCGRVLWQSL
jgi:hypothetical protein